MDSNFQASSLRTKCFYWRHILEYNPMKMLLTKYILGGIFLLHPFISCVILLVRDKKTDIEKDKYRFAFIPVFFLSLEICVVSVVLVIAVVNDCVKNRAIFSVWKREAVGRLLRNTVVSLLLLISFSFCLTFVSSRGDSVTVDSLGSILGPFILILIGTIVKLALISGKSQMFWGTVVFLSGLQISMWFLRNSGNHCSLWLDYVPSFCILAMLAIRKLKSAFKSLGLKHWMESVEKATAFVGIVLFMCSLAFFISFCRTKETYSKLNISVFIACLLNLTAGYCRKIGNFMYDMILGHVETDYNHFLIPPKILRHVPKRSFSELLFHLSHPLLKRPS